MIEFHHIADTNIIEIHVDGPVTREEYDRIAARLEQVFEQHDQVRVMQVFRNIGKIEPGALWADLKWTPRHLKHFSHAAIVADQKWVDWITRAMGLFISVEMELFTLDQLEEARRWIRTAE